MKKRWLASIAIHSLTASGAICGLIALHLGAIGNWSGAFVSLGLAAIIDGIDGPLARWIDVERHLPRFSGARLDLVVDYLNYCVVPAFIIVQSGLAGPIGSHVAGAAILMSSLFHFSDTQSKTEDGYFVGFPAIWNAVVLYFFVFDAPALLTLVAICFLSAATFVPLKWVHPVRVVAWRPATVVAMVLWSGAAAYEVFSGLPGTITARILLAATAAYLIFVGLRRSVRDQLSN